MRILPSVVMMNLETLGWMCLTPCFSVCGQSCRHRRSTCTPLGVAAPRHVILRIVSLLTLLAIGFVKGSPCFTMNYLSGDRVRACRNWLLFRIGILGVLAVSSGPGVAALEQDIPDRETDNFRQLPTPSNTLSALWGKLMLVTEGLRGGMRSYVSHATD